MTRSILVYREIEAPQHPDAATVIALHGRNASLTQLLPLVTTVRPDLRIVAPETTRAVYAGFDHRGRTWFGLGEPGYPEPASFGDSLIQLERFVLDVLDRTGRGSLPVLLGYDAGAVLALAAALVFPDRMSAVGAVCGYLPTIPGWTPPATRLDGLPVLLINSPDPQAPERLLFATGETLRSKEAALTTIDEPRARNLGDEIVTHLRGWLDEVISPAGGARTVSPP